MDDCDPDVDAGVCGCDGAFCESDSRWDVDWRLCDLEGVDSPKSARWGIDWASRTDLPDLRPNVDHAEGGTGEAVELDVVPSGGERWARLLRRWKMRRVRVSGEVDEGRVFPPSGVSIVVAGLDTDGEVEDKDAVDSERPCRRGVVAVVVCFVRVVSGCVGGDAGWVASVEWRRTRPLGLSGVRGGVSWLGPGARLASDDLRGGGGRCSYVAARALRSGCIFRSSGET